MAAEYIQIGITAARDPITGDFLPAVPLYIERTEAAEKSAEGLISDIVPLMRARFKQYAEESGLLEKRIAETISAAEAAGISSASSGDDQK